MDDNDTELGIYAYYENLSVSPSRQPLYNYILLVHITNSTGLDEVFRVYTDNDGEASFNFGTWSDGCINFEVIYCPFCDPASPQCGFEACLNYSGIETTATSVDGIALAPGESAISNLNDNKYYPARKSLDYCPPPDPLSSTPALCLPLLIIFAMLSSSMYLTGRNPFAGLNIGGARVGRHIRYQARGRGFSFSGMAALSAVSTMLRAAKALAQDEKKDKEGKVTQKGGWAALAEQESSAAKQRGVFFVRQARTTKAALKRGGQIGRAIGRAGGIGRVMFGSSWWRPSKSQKKAARGIEASSAGTGRSRDVAAAGASHIFMPGSSSFSPRLGELVGKEGIYGLGLLMYVTTSSTLGSILDSYVRSIDGMAKNNQGEGLFEKAFINYDARMANDEKALEDVHGQVCELDAEGNIIGIRSETADGKKVVVLKSVPGEEEGSTVYTIKVPKGKKGTADGRMEVTIETAKRKVRMPDGSIRTEEYQKVTSISFIASGVVPPSELNPDGNARVNVSINDAGEKTTTLTYAAVAGGVLPRTESNPDGNAMAEVTVTVAPDGKVEATRGYNDAAEQHISESITPPSWKWDRISPPSNTGISLGADVTAMHDTYVDNHTDVMAIQTSLNQSYNALVTRIESASMKKPINRDTMTPEEIKAAEEYNRKIDAEVKRAKEKILHEHLAVAVGGSTENVGSGNTSDLKLGRSSVVGAAEKTSKAWDDSDMDDHVRAAHHTDEFSGLGDENARVVGSATASFVRSKSTKELAGMSTADVRQGVIETTAAQLEGTGLSKAEARAKAVAIFDDAGPGLSRKINSHFAEISSDAKDFNKSMREAGISAEFTRRIISGASSNIIPIDATFSRSDVDILGSEHADLSRVPEEVARTARKYDRLTHVGNCIEESLYALNAGSIEEYGVSHKRYTDSAFDYAKQNSINIADREGSLGTYRKDVKMTDAQQLNLGLEQASAVRRIDSTLGYTLVSSGYLESRPPHERSFMEKTSRTETDFAMQEHRQRQRFNEAVKAGDYDTAFQICRRQYETYKPLAATGNKTMERVHGVWADRLSQVGDARFTKAKVPPIKPRKADHSEELKKSMTPEHYSRAQKIGVPDPLLKIGAEAVKARTSVVADSATNVSETRDRLYQENATLEDD
jgi:hypothetical protein